MQEIPLCSRGRTTSKRRWRIVDPLLKAGTPVHEYEPGSGDRRGGGKHLAPGGWQDPASTRRSHRPPKARPWRKCDEHG